MPVPTFATDLSRLDTHGFGHRSATWWGIVGFFLIEGTAFALALAAYFYLMSQEQAWPPPPYRPPDLVAGTLFTILVLLSEIPNTLTKQAAERGELRKLRRLLLLMSGIGLILVMLRAFEFNSLNIYWYDNAYGSVIWMLLVLHATHIGTDWVDTLVLAGLMHGRHGMEGRRFVDCSENAMYWRFVWLCWLPIYFVIYWVPRLHWS